MESTFFYFYNSCFHTSSHTVQAIYKSGFVIGIVNPEHIALKYYRDYHSGSAKTLKSIQITLAARLEKFNLESLASLTATDELDLPSLGEKKIALFALIPDNDTRLPSRTDVEKCAQPEGGWNPWNIFPENP